jgi:hypothetical protein
MNDVSNQTSYIVDGIVYAADFPVEFANNHLEDTGPKHCGNCAYFGCNDNDEFFGYCLNCIELYHGERPAGADPLNNDNYCQYCYSKLSVGHVCDNDTMSESYFSKGVERLETDNLFLNCEHGGSSNAYTQCFHSRCECVCHGCWYSRHPEEHCMHQYSQCDKPSTCECSCERCMTSDDKADYRQSLTEDL